MQFKTAFFSYDVAQDKGLTLVEVMIAIAIFSIGMLAVGKMQTDGLMHTTSARRTTAAMNVAQAQAEALMAAPFYLANDSDHDGNGCVNRYELNPDLLDGNYQLNEDWTGEYTVFWTISEGPMPCEGEGADPDGNPCTGTYVRSNCDVVLSKTIQLRVARTNNPADELISLNLVKTGAESVRLN